jgi:hypothetical protein
VWVDAHVLCTPAIADIDADGHDELVLAVSYFFDKEYYDNPARAKDLGDVLKDKYVAGEGSAGAEGDTCACRRFGLSIQLAVFKMAACVTTAAPGTAGMSAGCCLCSGVVMQGGWAGIIPTAAKHPPFALCGRRRWHCGV